MPWSSVVGDDFNAETGYDGVAQITIFIRRNETAFRTYAVSGPALEEISNHWNLLDLTPRGR